MSLIHVLKFKYVIALAIALTTAVILTDYRFTNRQRAAEIRAEEREIFPSGNDDHEQLRMVLDIPGLENPPLDEASQIRLADSERVVGVQVDDTFIAYVLKALDEPHIVNSFVQGRPLSVTYCSLVNCVRVLTSDGSEPIELALGGQDGNMQMVYFFEGARYRQNSKKLPLSDHPHAVVSWGEWREQHPDSLVFGATIPAQKQLPVL